MYGTCELKIKTVCMAKYNIEEVKNQETIR